MVVGTDHDLRVTAPKTVNRDGENPDASGVCGTCHAMHGGRGGRTLWNRESGEGRDQASRACTSCHRVGNDLGARVPPRAEAHLVHMPGSGPVSRVFTMGRVAAAGPAGIPLFAADGSPPGKGYLSCVSCHDVHRWEAGIANSGSGVPVEGDATNSFLRVRSSALNWTFCADCHGDSLLEHFRNYHFPEGR